MTASAAASAFAVPVGPVGRAEQQRGTGQGRQLRTASSLRAPGRAACGWLRWPPGSGRHRISVVLVTTATTSPCWLRAVCSKVTIPWPGRLADSRFSVTTVSP